MARLLVSTAGEVCLRLAGVEENAVLASLRRWPHWQRVVVERSTEDVTVCLAVTLATDSANEPALRSILKHGFGMTFPEGGGQSEGALSAEVRSPRHTKHRRSGA